MKKITLLIIIAVIVAGAIYFLLTPSQESGQKNTQPGNQPAATEKVFLKIIFDETNSQEVELDFQDGMTAFDALQSGTQKLGLNLETKQYDLGVFVETIGEKKNGQDDKYWLYYINDESAQVAADKLQLKAGDKIDWRFEKPSF